MSRVGTSTSPSWESQSPDPKSLALHHCLVEELIWIQTLPRPGVALQTILSWANIRSHKQRNKSVCSHASFSLTDWHLIPHTEVQSHWVWLHNQRQHAQLQSKQSKQCTTLFPEVRVHCYSHEATELASRSPTAPGTHCRAHEYWMSPHPGMIKDHGSCSHSPKSHWWLQDSDFRGLVNVSSPKLILTVKIVYPGCCFFSLWQMFYPAS